MTEDTAVGDVKSDDGRAGDNKVVADDVAAEDGGEDLTAEGSRSVDLGTDQATGA